MQVNWNFNANQYEPNQGMGIHPPAQKIPFTISNTSIVETKDKNGAMLVIEFTSPMGGLINRYNIHNANPKTVEIAYGQLSALCRAIGIYQIDGNNECAALRGGKGLMDVGYQKGEEPDPQYPDRKGYTELKRVYDLSGNEPGKAPAQNQPQTQPAGQAGGFGQPQATQQPQQSAPLTQAPGGGWNQPQQQAAQPQQNQPNPGPQGQAWQPGGAPQGQTPPWGPRT